MYSLRRKILIYFSVILLILLAFIFSASYISYRNFLLELINFFPDKFNVYIQESQLQDSFINVNTETMIFTLFIKKYQPIFFLLVIGSILVLIFSLSIINYLLKNLLGDLSYSFVSNSQNIPEELEKVQEKLSAYALEINQMNNKNKVFYSYASHELRNELALLRGLYNKNNITADEIFEQQENIETTIEDLLVLATLGNHIEFENVDALLEVANIIDKFFSDIPVNFIFDDDDDFIFKGKRTWFYRMVYNLLDNAFKYNNGSDITLILYERQGYIIIETVNDSKEAYTEFPPKAKNNGVGLQLIQAVAEKIDGYFYSEVLGNTIRIIVSIKK